MTPAQLMRASSGADALLGPCPLNDHEILDLARSALADPLARVGRWWVEPVDYPYRSPTTAGLFRLRGTATVDDAEVPWSVFVKLVHSYRHWPFFGVLPPEMQERAISGSQWRYETDVYECGLGSGLLEGLRLPRLYRVKDLGDERLALVLEDVRTVATPWTLARFARAAELLGRLAVRLTRGDCLPATALRVPGEITGLYYTGRVIPAVLPALADDAIGNHPLLAGDPDLRRDLLELARRVPAILERLVRLPQLMGHGDASPQNLLVPADEPGSFVAIDWTLGGLAAVGDDLGQLLVGLAHAGESGAEQLPELREILVPAYTTGLAREGLSVQESAVRYGMDGGLVVRSALTALPVERLHEPITDELAELVTARVHLTRYLVDLGLAMPHERGPIDLASADRATHRP